MFRVPFTLTALLRSGSSIDRGTDPSAARCKTTSAPRAASRQTSASRMSPSTNSIESSKGSRLAATPLLRLSRTRTATPSRTNASTIFDPMNPAPPVTKYNAAIPRRSPLSVSSRKHRLHRPSRRPSPANQHDRSPAPKPACDPGD